MEAKLDALEGELAEMRTSLVAVTTAMKDLPASLIAMMERSLGKMSHREDASANRDKGESSSAEVPEQPEANEGGPRTQPLHGDALAEFRQSVKKVELPIFDGRDPAGWISRAEVYFRVQETSPEVKVSLAQLSMDGPTIHFYNSLLESEAPLTWEKLRQALLERYGGHGDGDVYEQLTELRQKGTVEEYITEFEYLTAQIPKLPEKQYQGYFLHGLKEEIRGKARSLVAMGGVNRSRLLLIARAVEKEVRGEAGSGYNRSSRIGGAGFRTGDRPGPGRPGSTDWVWVKGAKDNGPATTNKPVFGGPKGDPKATTEARRAGPRDRGFSHLTYHELLERKQKGQCFKCGGPFHPMHKCPDRQLRVLLVEDGDDDAGDGNILAVEMNEMEDEVDGELSIMSLCNLVDHGEPPQTMRLQGKVRGVPVLVLVDSGATHNFVDHKVVQRMSWEVEDTPRMSIKLGDGFQTHTRGKCKELDLEIGDYKFSCTPHLFDLGGPDIVLGIEWLKTLGDTIANWGKHTMSFWHGTQWVRLQGLSAGVSSMGALQSILRRSDLDSKLAFGLLEHRHEVPKGQHLEAAQQESLQKLLQEYDSVFEAQEGLPPSRGKEHCINIKEGQGPVNVRPYRYPHTHKNEIERQVQEMLSAGIIRHSSSAYSSPVLLVKKKDQSWRMCVDYRALNKVTVPDKFPIPVIEELLDELNGAKFFSKLDLKSGYHQVRVRAEDVHKTAFRTHEGHYEFLVMPFGLMNAPSTFQSLMNAVFRPMLRKGVLVFFDDILVYSSDWEKHLLHLEKVLQLLQQQHLTANKKKCQFAQDSVEYLGHLISAQGVAVDPSKVASVKSWPVPKNVKGVRGFLGLTGYYRKFIRDYGKIARPLTDLTKKDAFQWGAAAQNAFETLKGKLTTAPVLALPDFEKEFLIECDASGCGLGAILMQDKKPIAYYSKALGPRNLAKSAYEKELMAVALAIQHWRPYLLGRKFLVSTDQKSLKELLHQKIITGEQQNWAAKLLGYDFDIVYKPGKLNKGADALSRVGEYGEIRTVCTYPRWEDHQLIATEVQQDAKLKHVIMELQNDPSTHPEFSLQQGILLYKGRLVLSHTSSLIPQMLKEFHATPHGGHSGFLRTYRRLAANIYWVGMKNTVQEFVRSCDTCQRQKYMASSPAGLLQPLPIPNQVWEDLSIDFITGLPKSRGYEAVLVVVDRLSKFCHFIPLKHPYTAKSIAELFAKEVIRLHGVPSTIVSDRDPVFMSHFWKELFRLQGTQLNMSSAYHPESDGQTEVVNRCLETYLRCFSADQPKTWATWIHWAEYWFNTSYHSATHMTPFEVVYGRKPPAITRWGLGETRVDAVQRELVDRDEVLRQLKAQLLRAQGRMKSQADTKRVEKSFTVGEWVFVKLRAHRQQSVVTRVHAKLAARYYGPYPIVARVGAVAYRLRLPEGSRVHPVFHVSLLKKAIGDYSAEADLPDQLEGECDDKDTPDTVLATRLVKLQGDTIQQLLIKWQGKTAEEATWEDALTIMSLYPNFNLGDKVVSSDGGIIRNYDPAAGPSESLAHVGSKPKEWKVYSRRGKRDKGSSN